MSRRTLSSMFLVTNAVNDTRVAITLNLLITQVAIAAELDWRVTEHRRYQHARISERSRTETDQHTSKSYGSKGCPERHPFPSKYWGLLL